MLRGAVVYLILRGAVKGSLRGRLRFAGDAETHGMLGRLEPGRMASRATRRREERGRRRGAGHDRAGNRGMSHAMFSQRSG